MKNLGDTIKLYINKITAIIMAAIVAGGTAISMYPGVLDEGKATGELYEKWQLEYIEKLKADYNSNNFQKINEQSFADFNIENAVSNGTKFNEIRFLTTHNSYKRGANNALAGIYNQLQIIGITKPGEIEYKFETLTEQLNKGVRGFELDIVAKNLDKKISFVCCHSTAIDMNSSCLNFELALEEIALWSKNNPNHLPVTVLIEPKDFYIPMKGLRPISLKYANILDERLRNIFGDSLLTPSDMMGKYDSFGDMRADNGWLPLKDTMGKVMILLHDAAVTTRYINQDKSVKSQAMFPVQRYADRKRDNALFILVNNPQKALEQKSELIDKYNLIVRTRLDVCPVHEKEDYDAGIASGAQLVSTDCPPRNLADYSDKYVAFLNGGYTVSLIK